MKMIYGTTNANKVIDIKAIIAAHGANIEVVSLKDINFYGEIEENGLTFEENSLIKALAVKEFCDKNKIEYDIITTDDAGTCVDCLDGAPGIYSARYAGENATQEECLKKLLSDIDKTGDKERKAQFICVLTSFLKDGTKIVSKGECHGTIAKEITILGGLTYAPVFIPEGYEVPMLQLSAEQYKKVHNHRDRAFEQLLEQIKQHNQK